MPKPKPIQITIPHPCHQSWDEMTPQGQGRYCAHCQKTVTDFSGWSDTALYDFFVKNKGREVCGRFNNAQLNPDIILHQPQSRLYRLFIGLGLTLILAQLPAGQTFAQAPVTQVQHVSTLTEHDTDTETADSIVIKGVVLDEINEPVIGAVVQIFHKDTVIGGVITDIDGLFNIAIAGTLNNDLKTANLKVSYTSYHTKEILLKKFDISKSIKIQLELNVKGLLGDLIILEYKVPLIDKWNAGTNTTITSDQIEKMPH